MSKKKILWFSRHQMTPEQESDLRRIYGENITINQVNKTIESAYEIAEEISENDVIAVVAPDDIKQEFFLLCKEQGKDLLETKNMRIFDEKNQKYQFVFGGWYLIEKIEIKKKKL